REIAIRSPPMSRSRSAYLREVKWGSLCTGAVLALTYACGSGGESGGDSDGSGGRSGEPIGGEPVGDLPAASCESEGGTEEVSEPTLIATLFDRWHEGWLSSPAVADLDEDGENEIIVPRERMLTVWHLDGT